jgi:transcriptional regulator with XRE-family HTH domain
MTRPESTPTPIGPFLRLIRNGANLSLRQAASVAHVNFTYLGQVERGEREPTSEWLASYVKALGVAIASEGDAA